MSEQSSLNGTSQIKSLELEIRHLFHHHATVLCSEKWKLSEEMSQWGSKLISQIQEHVQQQKELLESTYQQRKFYLEALCIRFLEQTQIYEQKQEFEQIDYWINKCNSLKFELARLVYIDRPISTIQLMTEGPLIQINREQCIEQKKSEDEQSPEKQGHACENNKISNTDTTETESLKSTYENVESTNTQPLTSNSMNGDNQSFVNSNHNVEANTSNADELFEKCPICYMIFPYGMTIHNRNLHVNEHY